MFVKTIKIKKNKKINKKIKKKINTFTFTSKPIPMYNKLDTSY